MPQFETPRTTPFFSSTILPAVLAILGSVREQWLGRWRGWWATLLLRRGGQAGPARIALATAPRLGSMQHTPLLSSHTASWPSELSCCYVPPLREWFPKAYTFRGEELRLAGLARITPVAAAPSCELQLYPTHTQQQRRQHGCSIRRCLCCAPIEFCCCQEAESLHVPAVAAASTATTAILGFRRMYVNAVGRHDRETRAG